MKVASFSFGDHGVLGFLTHLAEGLMPPQGRAGAPCAADVRSDAKQESVPVSSPTTADPGVPGPAAQWWQDHPAPGAPVFWIDETPKGR